MRNYKSNRAMFYLGLTATMACSDYNLQPQKQPESVPEPETVPQEAETGQPYLVVDPTSISIEAYCENEIHYQDITILNTGDGNLRIEDISLTGSGWTLIPVTLPLIIPPGDMSVVTLQVGAGEGLLTIQSNDPTDPNLWVELFASINTAPQVTITNPTEATIIPIGGMDLVASVTEDSDDLSSLLVEWSSNVDGVLGTANIDHTGLSVFPFSTSTHGQHEISASVYDSCGNEGYDAVGICQQYGYEAENLDISTWQFEGTANWDSNINVVELTKPLVNSAGTAFSTATTVNAENVEIEFQFFVSGGSGADGFSLTALDVNRMTGFVGSTGGGIGYGGLPGWSIEVDTYYNGHDPTSQDHIAFSFDGDVTNPVVWSALPEMEDNQWHTMKVIVAAPHILAQVDGVTYLDTTVSGNLNFPAYIGFTAGTGSLTNFHLIDSLTVTEMVCEE